MDIHASDTAVVITDPQNDVLRTGGPVWALVGGALETNRTVENLARLIDGATNNGFSVFVSPTTISRATTIGSLAVQSRT